MQSLFILLSFGYNNIQETSLINNLSDN